MADLITGIFHDRIGAENAVDRLETLGYEREEISVLMHDQTRAKEFADMTGTAPAASKSSAGAKIGAGVGGALAAIVAGIAAKRSDADDRGASVTTTSSTSTTGRPATGAQSTAPYGDVTAKSATPATGVTQPTAATQATYGSHEGSLEAASSGKAFVAGPLGATLAGASLGSLIGALAGAGVDKKLAERYERDLAAGGIVIGVAARPDSEARVRDVLLGHNGGATSTTGRL